MNKYVRITQARRREINQKRWAQEKCTTVNNKSEFPTSQILTNGISTCWMLEMATRNVAVKIIIMVGSVRKYRELKEMRQKEKPVLNMVTPVAQVLEMAKSEFKQKREDSIKGRGHKTATMDWNSLRY